jgi:hypothetical protein
MPLGMEFTSYALDVVHASWPVVRAQQLAKTNRSVQCLPFSDLALYNLAYLRRKRCVVEPVLDQGVC